MSEVTREEFDLIPSPRVLPMLGEINLEQWRCLGELIDNAVDGFLHAERGAAAVDDPVVRVMLPTSDREDATVQITDNGPGMTPAKLMSAVKAGWSGNNPTDNLGLFGMGFNIATARLGVVTEVWTTQAGDAEWHGLEIDFDRLQKQGNFRTAHLVDPKPDHQVSGTRITIRRLKPAQRAWLAKNPNQTLVRKTLSRAYSSMLRPGGLPIEFKLFLQNKIVQPRRACHWAENRLSPEIAGLGPVPAFMPFNFKLAPRFHCDQCMNWLPPLTEEPRLCPVCEAATPPQRRERRIHGWIGLQRYADTMDYGFDFVRNGRKIELSSKDLFLWRGENGDEPEYPIDDQSRRGRFIGEIHVDHCRVNFAKERFDRSDPSWDEMVKLIRGAGPLRPEKARELDFGENTSPLFRLYKAFRRMRPHSSVAGGWTRIICVPDNKVAAEFAQKFHDGHPDFQEDTRWWRLVEEMDKKLLSGDGSPDDSGRDDDDGGVVALPPDLVPTGGDASPTPPAAPTPAAPVVDPRSQRREVASLSRAYTHERSGQTFPVRAFECAANDPDLVSGAFWTLFMGEMPTNTRYFIFRSRADVFHSISLGPLDALLIELAHLIAEHLRNTPRSEKFPAILADLRLRYGQSQSLDARSIAMDAADALAVLARAIIDNAPTNDRGKLFDCLRPDQQAEVMRALAQKGVAPARPVADGTFLLSAPPSLIGRIIEEFPDLCFDGAFWATEYATLDYGDSSLTQRARDEVVSRARSLVNDAGWLSGADQGRLARARKEELVRGLMSVALIKPDRDVE